MTVPNGKPIALIATDLDGTLLTSAGNLAPESARRLKQASQRGLAVVLATTRNPYFAAPICRELDSQAPMICTNGAQVWGSPDGPVWATLAIPRETALAIARQADENGWKMATTIGQTTYYKQRPMQPLGRLTANQTIVESNTAGISADPVRILVWGDEAIARLRAYCQQSLSASCHCETYLNPDGSLDSLGIFANGADKGSALNLVMERLRLSPDQAVAFGDNLADLPLFAAAGASVAMGNAPEVVKRKASLVAPTNDQDGVAWGMSQLGI
jgi:Cof subfamily protein (haloacid dehalogenase superfamily)